MLHLVAKRPSSAVVLQSFMQSIEVDVAAEFAADCEKAIEAYAARMLFGTIHAMIGEGGETMRHLSEIAFTVIVMHRCWAYCLSPPVQQAL